MVARHREALRSRQTGELNAWEAPAIVVWPPAGSPVEKAPKPRQGARGGQRMWSDEVIAEALACSSRGVSKPEVAERLGLSVSTVKSWHDKARQAGVGLLRV